MLRTPAHLYGESIFTSTRSLDGILVYRREHLKRLFEHVRDYYFLGELDQKTFFNTFEIEKKIDEKLQDFPNHYFRLTIFANERDIMVPANFKLKDLNFDIQNKSLPMISKSVALQKVESPFTKFKSSLKGGSYFQNFFNRRLSMKAGFDDCLYIRDGKATEASSSNIIFGKSSSFYTPNVEDVFCGLSLQAFSKSDHQLEFRDILTDSFSQYDSCYLLNSVSLLTPVGQINDNFFTNTNYDFMLKKILKTVKEL